MNKEKMYHSNDLTNVKKAIEEISSESFRRKFLMKSRSGIYYDYDCNKYKSITEAQNKIPEARYALESASYYDRIEAKFIAGNNNEWIDIIQFATGDRIRAQTLFKLKNRGAQVVRIYKDFTLKIYHYRNDTWYVGKKGYYYYYNNDNIAIVDDVDESEGLMTKNEIFKCVDLFLNDIDYEEHLSPMSYNNRYRKLSKTTIEIIEKVFENLSKNKITKWIEFRDFIKKPNKYNVQISKAAQTRKLLIDTEFLPIIKKIKIPTVGINLSELEDLKNRGFDVRDYKSAHANVTCFHRIKEWIVFTNDETQRFFYNVKTNKKYCVNYYKNSTWRNECNIGIFKTEDLIDTLDNYTNYGRCQYVYPNGGLYRGEYIKYEDYEYAAAPKCYDENNNEITAEECFNGTSVLDFLSAQKNTIYYAIYNTSRNDVVPKCTYNDLVEDNRCPGFAFLYLCIKKDRRQLAEQLSKLNLHGLLAKLLTDPASFAGKEEKDNECIYRRNDNFQIIYDTNESSLKKALSLSVDKLKIIDKMVCRKLIGDSSQSKSLPNIAILQELYGESFKNFDNQTFEDWLEYLASQQNYRFLDNLKQVKSLFGENKSPKEFLKFLEKIGNLSIYNDYMRQRQQYLNYFNEDERKRLEKIYKLMPDKSKKFKYIRETRNRWGNVSTAEQQLSHLRSFYSNITPIENKKTKQIEGAILDMDVKETIRFLHDELSDFITAHAAEIEARGFKEAAKRLLKYEYQGKELSIVAPRESKELAVEGGTLHHCVASFINPVIHGTENVLFIRRNDMKESPFYTIAIDNMGRIEQIHGYWNNDLTAESQNDALCKSGLAVYNKTFDLIKFLKEWAKAKKDMIIESTIQNSYGALCARR